jgi:hypothetical protein
MLLSLFCSLAGRFTPSHHLSALETRLGELAELRDDMRRLLREWDSRLAHTPPGHRALLLDALATQPVAERRRGVRAR